MSIKLALFDIKRKLFLSLTFVLEIWIVIMLSVSAFKVLERRACYNEYGEDLMRFANIENVGWTGSKGLNINVGRWIAEFSDERLGFFDERMQIRCEQLGLIRTEIWSRSIAEQTLMRGSITGGFDTSDEEPQIMLVAKYKSRYKIGQTLSIPLFGAPVTVKICGFMGRYGNGINGANLNLDGVITADFPSDAVPERVFVFNASEEERIFDKYYGHMYFGGYEKIGSRYGPPNLQIAFCSLFFGFAFVSIVGVSLLRLPALKKKVAVEAMLGAPKASIIAAEFWEKAIIFSAAVLAAGLTVFIKYFFDIIQNIRLEIGAYAFFVPVGIALAAYFLVAVADAFTIARTLKKEKR